MSESRIKARNLLEGLKTEAWREVRNKSGTELNRTLERRSFDRTPK